MATSLPHITSVSRRLRLPSRGAWLGARAQNVLRRPSRLAGVGALAFVVVLGAYLAIPRGVQTALRLTVSEPPLAVDTVAPRTALGAALAAGRRADSMLQAARTSAPAVDAPAGLSLAQRQLRDSLGILLSELEPLVQRAANSPLPESYRALAGARAVRGDGAMRALLDSLVDIEREREDLGGGATVDPVYVALTTQANALGRAMLAVARRESERLRAGLAGIAPAEGGEGEVAAVLPVTPVIDTLPMLTEVANAQARARLAERQLAAARATNARRDSLLARQRDRQQLAPLPVLILAAGVIALFVALAAGLVDEMRSPRVADADEAERLSGLRVLSVVRRREVPAERSRRAADRALAPTLDPTADHYRILAWHLASPWPRDGVVTVTGDLPQVSATVAANLAAVLATDARSTLLVDTDFTSEPVREVLSLPSSPGLAAAVENRRKWSESLLSVPVGRSRSMDVLPAGRRDRPLGPAESQAGVSDIMRAAQRHDATVVAAPLPHALRMRAGDDVVVCAVQGVTRLATLARAVAALIDAGARVRGVVLWQGREPVAGA